MRSIFGKHGGNLGESGSVSYLFNPPKGYITVSRDVTDEDTLLSLALESGAEDVKTQDEFYEVYTAPGDVAHVQEMLEAGAIKTLGSEVIMTPLNTVRVEGKEAEQIIHLVERLEEHDDVQNVHANFDIPDEVLEAAAG